MDEYQKPEKIIPYKEVKKCPACGKEGLHLCNPPCKKCGETGLHVCTPEVVKLLLKSPRFILLVFVLSIFVNLLMRLI